jgi:hypothetical protein
MAFAAAIPGVVAAVGGGSMAAGAATLAAAAATVYTGVSAAQQARTAGKVTQAETEIAARAEGDSARQREIERKRMLLRALSAQQAGAAAAGIRSDQGSPATLMNLDIAQARGDNDVDNLNTRTRQRALRMRGANAASAGSAQANATLVDTGLRTYQAFGK